MSVSVLECLQNAEFNLDNMAGVIPGVREIAIQQLHNGVTLLEKGYGVDDEVDPLLDQYGDVEAVPDKGTI